MKIIWSMEPRGNNTIDKLFLLSESEVAKAEYGFQSNRGYYDQARHAKVTEYAQGQMVYTSLDGTECWWLRSPGGVSDSASQVLYYGCVYGGGFFVDDGDYGVRPALHVNVADATIQTALANKESQEVALKKSTWDTVEFGSYEGNPITWRVLSVGGEDALLLADRILLEKAYRDGDESATWETSTLRTWLNEDFYGGAFTSEEQRAIMETTVTNPDNPFYETEGGADTKDKVYLLSLEDMVNPAYGFPTAYGCESPAREATPTDSEDTSCWWLRSPGGNSSYASYVRYYGYVYDYGNYVDDYDYGVRPALHLNLSSSAWKKGEVVTSDDRKEVLVPSETGKPVQTQNPVVTNSPVADTNMPNGAGSTSSNIFQNQQENTTVAITPEDTTQENTVTAPSKVKSLRTVNKKAKKVIVSFKKANDATGYQIQYATNKKFTKKKKSKTTTKTSYTIKKLKKKTVYFIRVRAYKKVNGENVYGKWSGVKKVKIKK